MAYLPCQHCHQALHLPTVHLLTAHLLTLTRPAYAFEASSCCQLPCMYDTRLTDQSPLAAFLLGVLLNARLVPALQVDAVESIFS